MTLTRSNHSLHITEMPRDGPGISQFLPVTSENDTWLSDALQGPRPYPEEAMDGLSGGPASLSSSTALLVDLPSNVSFISVLGTRFMAPGAGGECRFAFDPQLSWNEGLRHYAFSDTGNPYYVDYSYSNRNVTVSTSSVAKGAANAAPVDTIDDVRLLDLRLDSRIQYKLAIVRGPTGSGVLTKANSSYRSSPGDCDFSRIQLWRK